MLNNVTGECRENKKVSLLNNEAQNIPVKTVHTVPDCVQIHDDFTPQKQKIKFVFT